MAWIWFALEAHLAVICASAPALKLFFKQTLKVSSFGNSGNKAYSSEPTSNSAGSNTMDKFKKTKPRKLGLNDITMDTDDGTFELSTAAIREKPFTIFKSEERLSGGYDDTFANITDTHKPADLEAGRIPHHGTFFADTDSD